MKMYIILFILGFLLLTGCNIEPKIIEIPKTDFDDIYLACHNDSYCHLSSQTNNTLYFNFTSIPNGTQFNYRVDG